MSDKLTQEQRLKQSITKLKKSNQGLRLENKELKKNVIMLEKEVKEWKLKFKDKELQRKDLLEKIYKSNKNNDNPKPLGKKVGAKGYHRAKPKDSEVTEKTEFKPTRCPYCKQSDGLNKPQETIIKYTEDIVIVPDKIVKKYIIHKCWCSHCKEYIRSDKIPPNIKRIGPNTMAYILYARYRLRLPYNKIKQSLNDLHNFNISEGEISEQLDRAKQLFNTDYDNIKELIKISDKVYCDETGWRIRGKNFWIWVFVTDKNIRYVIEDTRGKGVPEQALGNNEDRVLISDFYAAYKNLSGTNQYCWVHLLRDSKLTESQFHNDLQEFYHQLKLELTKDLEKRDYKRLDRLLEEISNKDYNDQNIERVKQLQKRIQKNRSELLTCLKHKDILPENNTAERALRNNVVMRKIFGCSRSINSAKTMEVNTSVIDTWLMQNPDKSFFQIVLPKLKKLRDEG
jgi:transposase